MCLLQKSDCLQYALPIQKEKGIAQIKYNRSIIYIKKKWRDENIFFFFFQHPPGWKIPRKKNIVIDVSRFENSMHRASQGSLQSGEGA